MTNVTTISAQRYLDDAIVARKLAARDFTVFVSPAFEVDGETFRVVTNGHHSLAAANEAGVDAEFVEHTSSEDDTIALLKAGNIDDFLIVNRFDSDYYDIATGRAVW